MLPKQVDKLLIMIKKERLGLTMLKVIVRSGDGKRMNYHVLFVYFF